MDEITHEPLPRRWVDLIHRLDEQERKRSGERGQAQTRCRACHESEAQGESGMTLAHFELALWTLTYSDMQELVDAGAIEDRD